jgi:two-component sensor histidine kinase
VALSTVWQAEAAMGQSDRTHLDHLVGWWAVLADLCFSDLVLYLPVDVEAEGSTVDGFVMAQHIRPATSQTIYPTELVGEVRTTTQRPLVAEAFVTGGMVEGRIDSAWLGEQIQVEAIPVCRGDHVVAVITREFVSSTRREAGELERTYAEVFNRFAQMIGAGALPFGVEEDRLPDGPRVGDGVIVTDGGGVITYASPNAVSALMRPSAGSGPKVVGERLDQVGLGSVGLDALVTRQPASVEIGTGGDIIISIRCIPLLAAGEVTGSVVLLRDISDLRRRDRMLLSKDATIREIHHRVKNNLQTISALLRLQGRRLVEPSARLAVEESVRRIRAIAIVHEILSREPGDDVPFADILRPLIRMVEEGLVSSERPVRFAVEGDPGLLPSPAATSLAVVLSELFQNVVEHAYPLSLGPAEGLVRVRFDNRGEHLAVVVEDDGVGLPVGYTIDGSDSLGLSIVRTLVTSELGGTIAVGPADGAAPRVGTRFELSVIIDDSGDRLPNR